MTFSDRSYPKNARNARVTRMSWNVATMAPTAKLKPEAERDVDGDAQDREQRRADALALQLRADDRPDHLGADDLELAEVRPPSAPSVAALTSCSSRRAFFALDGLRQPDQDLAGRGRAVLLDDLLAGHRRPAPSRTASSLTACSNLQDHDRAALEVDAQRQPLGDHHDDAPATMTTSDRTMACQRHRMKLKLGLREDLHGLDAQCRHAAAARGPVRTMVRDTNTDVNTFDSRPIDSVVAKPRIGPVPNWNRNAAEMSDATWVSRIVRNTRSNPARDGLLDALRRRPALP